MAITVLPCIRVFRLLWIADLDFGVECAGGFVEQQDGRVLQHHARDRDALALAAGQLHAALAHVGVVAVAAVRVGQVGDEVVRPRRAARPARISSSLASGRL